MPKKKKKKKNVVLFPEIDRVKKFLSLTHRQHSRMCIRIYIFNFKEKRRKAKETKEEKRISVENLHTFKNKNKKNSLRVIFVYYFLFHICLFVAANLL